MTTREEVMALSDEELRIKAAKLMGFDDDAISYMQVIPDYPNDIAAAWGLWELLPPRRGVDEIGGMFYVPFGMPLESDDGCQGEGEGDTVPRAITRAFVLARMG